MFQPQGDVFQVFDIGDDVLTIVIVRCKAMVQHAFGMTKAHEGNDPQSQHTGYRGHALKEDFAIEVSLLKRKYRHQNEGPRGEEVVIVESKLEVEEYVQSAKAQKQPKAEFFNERKIAAEFEDGVQPDANDTHQAPCGVKGVFPSVEAIFCDLDEFTDGFARVYLLKEVGVIGAVGEVG